MVMALVQCSDAYSAWVVSKRILCSAAGILSGRREFALYSSLRVPFFGLFVVCVKPPERF